MEKHLKRQWLCWLVLFILVLIEYSLFRNYSLREIVPFYPKSYDQTGYLAESYKLYEHMLAKGRIFAALIHHNLLSQTLLFHIQGALTFLVFGANRMVALSINFFYFVLLQLFAVYALHNLTGRYRYGFMFIGLMLAANSLTLANDFRIDFIASCLYGILCFAILQSNVFLSRKWTLVSAAIALFLVLMRYITICYVLGVLGMLVVWYASLWLIKKSAKQGVKVRLINLFIFGACVFIVILPVIYLNWDILQAYYVVGHVTGGEKLMRLTVGLKALHLDQAYLFYPIAFFDMHLSINTVIQMAFFTGICGVLWCFLRKNPDVQSAKGSLDYTNIFLFLVSSVFVPLFVLSMDQSKSLLVINIILVPFIALLLFSYIYFSEKLWCKSPAIASKVLSAASVFMLLAGLYNYAVHFSKERYHALSDDKDFVVTQMVGTMGEYAAFLNWQQVNLASDYLADYINAPLSAFYYERSGRYVDLNTLPLGNNGMTALSKAQALDSLKQVDIYTVNLTDYTPDPIFPFENSIKPFRAELHKIAMANMITLGDYFIFDNALRIYARPDVRIKSTIDKKITRTGLWLDIPAVVAQQVQSIELRGNSNANGLNEKLKFYINGKEAGYVKIKNQHYQLIIKLPNWQSEKPLTLHITFAGNHDKLTMSVPTQKIFVKK